MKYVKYSFFLGSGYSKSGGAFKTSKNVNGANSGSVSVYSQSSHHIPQAIATYINFVLILIQKSKKKNS